MGMLIRLGVVAVVIQVLAFMFFVVMLFAPLASVLPTVGVSQSGQVRIEPGKGATSIVEAAQALSQHLSGVRSNLYDPNDPFMRPVYAYWKSICPGSNDDVCWYAHTGTLQCVYFAVGTYYLAGYPLPQIANAVDFWPKYQHQQGWRTISSTEYPPSQRGFPAPGDLMIWKGGEAGHIAVVLAVTPPHNGKDGSVTVAQANAPGNRWPAGQSADAANWYTMPLHPDLSIETWTKPDVYTVRGFLRQA
ncbi:CHAP domain-containing protein [Ktedonospora formicarum]|uniref:Peptidase C51 domain-containing protein n=1 Tax=Ktedonospora formicarum TaxID=2778364 RepID=A0A8J3I9A1_9CHLR|nr:CHAP domain-containing protein [Ktedonospora formicarum]GHO49185.1 hypothetical protein KSX_73480 [Ktedonospora formicarum]